MNVRIPPLLWFAVLASAGMAGVGENRPPAAASGTVEGTVRVEVEPTSEPPTRNPYSRRRYRSPPNPASRSSSHSNVVVFVLVDDPRPPTADTTVRILQRDRTIVPHVTAIQVGTRIDFPNLDEVYHNLFSLSSPRPFNLGRYPPGESRTEAFESPGVIRMFCDIHSDMTAVIRVVDTPHFARADEDGRFRIPGLPPGRHRVAAWHPSADADTVQVDIPDGGVARADLRLGR